MPGRNHQKIERKLRMPAPGEDTSTVRSARLTRDLRQTTLRFCCLPPADGSARQCRRVPNCGRQPDTKAGWKTVLLRLVDNNDSASECLSARAAAIPAKHPQ